MTSWQPHGTFLKVGHKGGGADLVSGDQHRSKWNDTTSHEVHTGHEEKVLHREHQAPRRSGHNPKRVRLYRVPGQHSWSRGLVFGSPARSRELDTISLWVSSSLR